MHVNNIQRGKSLLSMRFGDAASEFIGAPAPRYARLRAYLGTAGMYVISFALTMPSSSRAAFSM